MQLKHIDNGFYHLTAHQARLLAEDGKLPRPGYEKRAQVSTELVLLQPARCTNELTWVERPLDRTNLIGWILQTKCTWHDGQLLEDPWVWAIYFCRVGRYGETFQWNAR